MININTSIPDQSKYFIYADVPFRYASRHFKIGFVETSQTNSLGNRIKHIILGALLCIPIVNIICAIAEKILIQPKKLGPKEKTHTKKHNPKVISDTSEITPLNVTGKEKKVLNASPVSTISTASTPTSAPITAPNPEVPPQPKELTAVEKILKERALVKEKRRRNPYVFINRKEIVNDPTRRNYKRLYPLKEAINSQNVNQVRELIQNPSFIGLNRSYDVDIIIPKGGVRDCTSFPLFEALVVDNKEIFDILINADKINPDIVLDNFGEWTAFHKACSMGDKGQYYIDKLIEKKANPSLKSREGETPLDVALKNGLSGDCLQRLKDWTLVNEINSSRNNKLQEAVLSGNKFDFDQALAGGICLNNRDYYGNTALIQALRKLQVNEQNSFQNKIYMEMITKLLEAGALVDLSDRNGYTPLLLSLFPVINEELALLLLEKFHADHKHVNKEGVSAFTLLVGYPDTHPIKKWLLENTKGQYKSMENQKSINTLMGMISSINRIIHKGGNFPGFTFSILENAFADFIKDEEVPQELKEFLPQIQESIQLGNVIANSQDLTDAIKQVQKAQFPLLIPTGWEDHVFATVMYNDQTIIANRGDRSRDDVCGIQVFNGGSKYLTSSILKKIASNGIKEKNSCLKKSEFTSELCKHMGLLRSHHIEMSGQKHSNCSWSSSALLGLRCVCEVLLAKKNGTNVQKTEVVDKFIKKFNHYARMWMIKKTIREYKEGLEDNPAELDGGFLGDVALQLCSKIKKGLDIHGYYRKSLDEITFSGLKIETHCFYCADRKLGFEIEDALTYYASLYGEYRRSFKQALSPDTKIGDWE